MVTPRAPAPPVTIPLVDLQKQMLVLRSGIEARIADVLARGDFVLGRAVGELEARLAAYSGAATAIAVANGTDALLILLKAQGIGRGDAVFVPAFTFAATAGAVVLSGATPVFVDIDETSLNMDPRHLEVQIAKVQSASELRARAVIPVDLFGRPADYKAIIALAEMSGMILIADAAQSYGAEQDGHRVGKLAPASAISFYPSKPLGCFGDGGAILTCDPALGAACRRLRAHGFDSAGEPQEVGLNSRLDSLQAAVLLAKLDAFDAELAAREMAASWYRERLSPHLRVPAPAADGRSAWAVYAVRAPQRDALRAALTAAGIASAVYYRKPLHLTAAYAGYGAWPGSLPVSERVSAEILALPMHGYLDEATVARVCDILLGALEKRSGGTVQARFT